MSNLNLEAIVISKKFTKSSSITFIGACLSVVKTVGTVTVS